MPSAEASGFECFNQLCWGRTNYSGLPGAIQTLCIVANWSAARFGTTPPNLRLAAVVYRPQRDQHRKGATASLINFMDNTIDEGRCDMGGTPFGGRTVTML